MPLTRLIEQVAVRINPHNHRVRLVRECLWRTHLHELVAVENHLQVVHVDEQETRLSGSKRARVVKSLVVHNRNVVEYRRSIRLVLWACAGDIVIGPKSLHVKPAAFTIREDHMSTEL